jgi:hypothetical protein
VAEGAHVFRAVPAVAAQLFRSFPIQDFLFHLRFLCLWCDIARRLGGSYCNCRRAIRQAAKFGVWNTAACHKQTCALRAPTVFFGTDKDHPYQKIRFWLTPNAAWGVIQDRRLRTDGFIIHAQSTIRADGFSSAQYRNSEAARVLSRHA